MGDKSISKIRMLIEVFIYDLFGYIFRFKFKEDKRNIVSMEGKIIIKSREVNFN